MSENNVIIVGFSNPTEEGVILQLNKRTCLKGNHLTSSEFWVSWDKIGKALFENYTDESDVASLTKLRRASML